MRLRKPIIAFLLRTLVFSMGTLRRKLQIYVGFSCGSSHVMVEEKLEKE